MPLHPSNPLKEQEIAVETEPPAQPARFEIDDLWRIADAGLKPEGVMSFEEMNAAKARGAQRS